MDVTVRDTAKDTPPTGSTLESVVVYAAGAVCVRRARCVLAAGAGGTVRIDGLPVTLDEHTLRARVVSGPAGLRVTDVRADLAVTTRRGDRLPGLRLDLEDAEDQVSRLADRRDRLAAEVTEVAAFRAEPPQPRRGEPPRWAPIESILTLAGFVDTRLALLHDRLRAAEDELARAEHDADVLRHRLEQASTALRTDRARPVLTAVLTLAHDPSASAPDAASPSAGPGDPAPATSRDVPPDSVAADVEVNAGVDLNADAELELELEYRVPGASWAPVYQLRLAGGGTGDSTLVMRASVAQRTGEDWTGVRLGLSTADLLRRADLPELRSLRIGRGQPEPRTHGWREPPAGLAELFTGYDTAVAARPADERSAALPVSLPPAFRPPPAPAAYGAASPAAVDRPDEDDGPLMAGGSPGGPVRAPAPVAAAAPRAARHHAKRYGPIAPGGAPPAGAPADAPPADDLLDYARLTLAGPDAPRARGTLRPDPASPDAVVAEYRGRAEAVRRLARPAHAADVRESAGAFDYRFDTAAPVDVVADGAWHTVPVCEIPARTESAYVCVPAVDPAVYGTVLVTNTSAHALLAGPADVVVDGDFVLTAALPTLAPGERQAVGVGVVESVRVARRTHMRESTAGLRGGTTVLDHTVEVEIANRLPHPVTVEVRERIPVSADKDVRVEEHRATPPWAAPDEPLAGQDDALVRGARVWHAEVAAGRTTTLNGGYEIRLPAGKAVVGGNRRS
ncbi:DUF4139 domain-containing protein [Streptantibioticus silvisoli]|uniref:DUF4139 domain-containing protein n=1 Tax=Streptantibioticus silvisoli TaxID=2705255 RepID=A0ABT6W5B8_9ACTN|nr:DUF4139 domain-containing protein [Streptantibioticus silvisoli]MDI5964716.1 DUF4139 domain-containing protein [Streptantibioticus silvisoli]